jgi:Na+/proline symporter/signal transduction histidine kinase
MFSPWSVGLILALYMALLFGAALWGERSRLGARLAESPWVYALALAVYCTSWTYYGSVGSAANSGFLFLAIYLGPTLVMLAAPTLIRRMIRFRDAHRVTSLADFISARYGKTTHIAVLATLMAVLSLIPYIALQLKSIILTFNIMVAGEKGFFPSFAGGHFIDELSVVFVILLSIMFGLRRLDSSEHRKGLMLALAVESLVKLLAFLMAGAFVTWGLFGGLDDILGRVEVARQAQQGLFGGTPDGRWYVTFFTFLALAMSAILFLPRQFHVTVIENTHPRHLRTAMWLFPLYLLLINLFVFPIAAAGVLKGYPTQFADAYVLGLPLFNGGPLLALFVFLGGFSAAVGMIMVESVALSIMASNYLLVPLAQRYAPLAFLRRRLLLARWLIVAAIVLFAYVFQKEVGASHFLVAMGLISFAGVLQFAPAMFIGLYWRGASQAGAFWGLLAGFGVWFYTLFLPAVLKSGGGTSDLLLHGPFGIGWLAPESLFGLTALPPLSQGVFWSLLANVALFVLGSALRPHAGHADSALGPDSLPETGWGESLELKVDLAEKTAALKAIFEHYMSADAAAQSLAQLLSRAELLGHVRITARQLARLLNEAETLLAGAIGATGARNALRETQLLTKTEARELRRVYTQILVELNLTPEELRRKVDYFQEKNVLAQRHAEELEQKVAERTDMLSEAVARLREEIGERQRIQDALQQSYQQVVEVNRKLEEAHHQLLQSEKMASIGQLAAGVAHEINNPIGFVHSNLGTLDKYVGDLLRLIAAYEALEQQAGEERGGEAAGNLRREIDLDFLREDVPALLQETREGVVRVKQIVKDLKDFSHVDESEWQVTDLHQGLDSTLNVVWNELKYKARVVKEYGQLPLVECIPSQLNQVFMNLLVNAAQAIPDQGTITIRTGQEGDQAWVEVSDTGKGIPPENLHRIFEPFFTTKPVGKGTGLGLSLSYGIVRKHGGRIEVASEVGQGTRFRVWIPVRRSRGES